MKSVVLYRAAAEGRHYLNRARLPRAAGVLTAALALASCAKTEIMPPCPEVRVDSATAQLTKFRDGPGRAPGDVEYRVEIAGFKGDCEVDKKDTDVRMTADFLITPGPAARPGKVPVYYFLAIPQLFPKPVGKKIFEQAVEFKPNAAAPQRVRVSDLRVKIPLAKDQPAAAFDVYLGLQLSNDQLEFNRTSAR